MSETNELDETIKEFLVEAQENMEDAYKCLDALEANPEDLEPIRSLFRSIHSIKGAAGFFNFSTLEGVGHFCESILSKLRDGEFSMTPKRQALVYEAADAIDKTIASLIETGKEGEEEYIELIMRLRDDSQSEEDSASGTASEENSVEEKAAEEQGAGSAPFEEVEVSAEAEDATPEEAEEIVSTEANEELVPDEKSGENSPPPEQVEASPPAVAGKAAASEATAPSSGISESSIRVDVSLLDKLMNLVEELVLSRNQILRHTAGIDNNDLTNASQVFSLVTSELQEGIMKTRM